MDLQFSNIKWLSAFFILALNAFPPGLTAQKQYLQMAPINDYLLDRDREIDLARSAAPDYYSSEATILVLTKNGYETAIEGNNGFVCMVDRAWTGPWANPEFWNPKHIDPICFNAEGVETVLPHDLFRTELALKGLSKEEIRRKVYQAYGDGSLIPPKAGALALMMSKYQNLGDDIGHWHPHIMYYTPYNNYINLFAAGQNAPATPFEGQNEAITTTLIPVPHWSDGTPDYGHRGISLLEKSFAINYLEKTLIEWKLLAKQGSIQKAKNKNQLHQAIRDLIALEKWVQKKLTSFLSAPTTISHSDMKDLNLFTELKKSQKKAKNLFQALDIQSTIKAGHKTNELLSEFEALRAKTLDILETPGNILRKSTISHPEYGNLDAFQWILLLGMLNESQIKSMKN